MSIDSGRLTTSSRRWTTMMILGGMRRMALVWLVLGAIGMAGCRGGPAPAISPSPGVLAEVVETASPMLAVANTPTPTVKQLPTALPETIIPVSSQPTVTVLPTSPKSTATPLVPASKLSPSPMPVYLPLPESGPVFAYLKWQNERWLLVETASGGQARQEFSLPPEAYFDDLQTALSPDGRTLAFYSGQPPGPPYDLALNLLDLQSGQVTRLTALLSVDYPDNFQELAGFLAQSSEREPTSAEDLRQTFILGIYSLAWSPDGRFLAFAGQMQGLSSDIYLYDVRTRFIQRLTDGPENVQWLRWSLDSLHILHASAYFVTSGENKTYHVVDIDPVESRTLKNIPTCGAGMAFDQWIDSTHIWAYCGDFTGAGNFPLHNLDITTDRAVNVFNDRFESYAYDPRNNLLAVSRLFSFYMDEHPDYIPGLYLYHPETGEMNSIIQNPDWDIQDWQAFYWDTPITRFVVSGSFGVVGVAADGSTKSFGIQPYQRVIISPNQRWLIFYGDRYTNQQVPGMKLLDSANQQPLILPEQLGRMKIGEIFWNPDSSGLFLTSDDLLYYLDIFDSEMTLVDSIGYGENILRKTPLGTVWFPHPYTWAQR